MNLSQENKKPDLVTVPNLSAAELVVEAVRKLSIYVLSPDYASWDFIRDERGRTYEAITWSPNSVRSMEEYVTMHEAREHFRRLGADGNTPAFIAWIMKNDPMGYWRSVPSEDDRLLREDTPQFLRNVEFELYAPSFLRLPDDQRNLELCLLDGSRWAPHSYVAFRKVESGKPSE